MRPLHDNAAAACRRHMLPSVLHKHTLLLPGVRGWVLQRLFQEVYGRSQHQWGSRQHPCQRLGGGGRQAGGTHGQQAVPARAYCVGMLPEPQRERCAEVVQAQPAERLKLANCAALKPNAPAAAHCGAATRADMCIPPALMEQRRCQTGNSGRATDCHERLDLQGIMVWLGPGGAAPSEGSGWGELGCISQA